MAVLSSLFSSVFKTGVARTELVPAPCDSSESLSCMVPPAHPRLRCEWKNLPSRGLSIPHMGVGNNLAAYALRENMKGAGEGFKAILS